MSPRLFSSPVLLTLSSLAFILASLSLLPMARASPTTIPSKYLSSGWSGHAKRSGTSLGMSSTSWLYPFDAQDVLATGCREICQPFTALNVTCGANYFLPACDICSTAGLNAYLSCALCWTDGAQSTPSTTTKGDDLEQVSQALSTMENRCTSYTRTALPSSFQLENLTSAMTTYSSRTATIISTSSTSAGTPTVGRQLRFGYTQFPLVLVSVGSLLLHFWSISH